VVEVVVTLATMVLNWAIASEEEIPRMDSATRAKSE